METLRIWLESSHLPLLSAFILGLMTAISPCPLATNISATAYIARSFSKPQQVLFSGLVYTLGRAFSYTLIGWAIYFGASKFHIAKTFQSNGERYLGFILILLGLIMLGIIKLNFLTGSSIQERLSEKLKDKGNIGTFLLGALFAMAFCPYSGALFFSMLIPMTLSEAGGLLFPLIFALGTGLPVLLFTYLIAFSIGKVGQYFKVMQQIEKVMRYATSIVFILTGIYYVWIFFGKYF